jgi:hypothetical protein
VRLPCGCVSDSSLRGNWEGKNVVMTALIETSSDRWKRMVRSTGVVGLVTFVVLFAALIASSPGEPQFLASPQAADGRADPSGE